MQLVPPGSAGGALRAIVLVVPVLSVSLALRARIPLPLGGWLAVAASIAALAGHDLNIAALAAGAALAGAGGVVARRFVLPLAARPPLVLPGAVVAVIALDDGGPRWMVVAGVLAAAVVGVAADLVDDEFGANGMTLTMVAISSVGVFVTIPETGMIVPVMAALWVLAALGWPVGAMRLGPGGGSAVITLLAALTVNGGWTRPGAIVGGLAASALLLVLALPGTPRPRSGPVAVRAPDGRVRPRMAGPTILLLVVHGLVALAVSRIAGLRHDLWSAVTLAVFFLAAGWWAATKVASPTDGIRQQGRSAEH